MIKKYGENVGKEKYKAWMLKISNVKFNQVSKESWIFFEPIMKFLFKNNFLKTDFIIGTSKRKEFYIYSDKKSKLFYYDFAIPSIKLIIEYNGEMFHPNPSWSKEKWNNWKCLRSNVSADEKYRFDKSKEDLAKSLGYSVISIFSSDNYDEKYHLIKNEITRRLSE